MLKYEWKRYWSPVSQEIYLDCDGYLPDPDTINWRYNNFSPKPIGFESIADQHCLVLLGEAGMGKTTAMEAAHELTYQQPQNSDDICLPLFRLGDYSSDGDLCNVIFKSQDFQKWIQGSYKLHLFLDSLDEGLLSIDNLIRILRRELIKELPYERLYFRINCRTAVWPNSLTEKFRELWRKEEVHIYQIASLRRIDVVEALQKNQIDSNSFLQEVFDKKAVPLANKPITLQFLIDIYKAKGQLPNSQKELYEQGCLQLCKEVNPDRYEAGHDGKISDEQRMIISARIASIMIFCNRSTIWTSPKDVSISESDINFSDIRVNKEKIAQEVFAINDDDCIKEVLKITGLFSSQKSMNQIGFVHKSYAEFLAAWYLTKHETPLAQIQQLLFSSVDSEWKLIPQLYETAVWLASMREDVLKEIIKTNPDVLLQSDIPNEDSIKASIVDTFLRLHDQNQIKNNFGNYYKYVKLKNSNLPEQLRVYITDSSKNTNTRNLAVDIAKACQCKDLQRDLLKLSLDQSQDIYLRANAADAIASIGDAETKLALKTLLKQDLIEDESDELKGYILQALWPDYITAEELFNSLTKPKQDNYSGSYKYFINIDLLPKLKPNDLVIALKWLIKQDYKLSEDSFAKIGDCLLLKAWENFNLPGIAESLARVIFLKSQNYTFFIVDNQLQHQFRVWLNEGTEKRHLLLKKLVNIFANLEKIPDIYLSHIVRLTATSNDTKWMIKMLQQEINIKSQEVWSHMIDNIFNVYTQDLEEIHLLLETSQNNHFLREACKLRLQPIELDSWQAKSWKKNRLLQENEQSVAQVSSENIDEKQLITESIKPHLEQLEQGNILEWCNICQVLQCDSQGNIRYT
jgi:predicted NACHT family NTPase